MGKEAGAEAGKEAGAEAGKEAGAEAGKEAGTEVAVAAVDAAVSSSGMLDVEMGLRKLGMPPGAAGAAAASVAQQLSSSAMAPFQGAALCQLPPAEQALVPSARGLTAVELPMQTVMTLTLTGTFATFDTADFKARLAARLDLQVQQIKVKKVRPKSYVVGTSADAVDGIAVEVDEDRYLRCTGSGSLSDGSEASEDDRDDIRSAIRLALKPIKVPAKDAITIEWVEEGSVIVCITLPLPLAIILMDLHRLRDPGLEALGLRSHVIGEQRQVAPPSQAELVAFDDVIRGIIFAPNHFEALGLPLSAAVDAKQVLKAFRDLAKQVHPDKNPYDDDEAAAAVDAAAAAEAKAAAEEAAAAEAKATEAGEATLEQAASEGAGEQSQPEQAVAIEEPPSKKPRIAEELEAPAEVVAPRSKLGAEPAMKRLLEAKLVLSDAVGLVGHLQAYQGGMTMRGAWEQEAIEELRQLRAAHTAVLLVLVGNPKVHPLPNVAVQAKQISQYSRVPAVVLQSGMLEDLRAEMQKRPVQRFAFLGHGDAKWGDEKTLSFTAPDGELSLVSPSAIVELLGAHSPRAGGKLELVFLSDGNEALAQSLHAEAAIPVVVSLNAPFHDAAACIFEDAFFKNLAATNDYRRAFAAARLALLLASKPGQLDTGKTSEVPKYQLKRAKSSEPYSATELKHGEPVGVPVLLADPSWPLQPVRAPVLELLIFMCNPSSAPLPTLEREATQIQQLFPGALILRDGTPEDLRAVMQQHSVRRFAFLGHGDALLGGELTLGFTTKEGMLSVVSPSTVVELLGAHSPQAGGKLELVFLNCDMSLALGEKLSNAGVPNVMCWESLINDEAATLFSAGFFKALQKDVSYDSRQSLP